MGVHIGPVTAGARQTLRRFPVRGRQYAYDRPRKGAAERPRLYGHDLFVRFRCSLRRYADLVAEYIRLVLDRLPPRAAAFAVRRGIRLSAAVRGWSASTSIVRRLWNADVIVPQEPQLSVVRGGGIAVRDLSVLDAVSIEY